MDPTSTLAARMQVARQQFASGEFEAASAAAREALALGPDEPAILALLGQIEHARHRPADALRWFDAAVAVAPHDARLRANRSAVRLAADDAIGAEADARVATDADPASFGAWLNLGLALEAQSRHGEAAAGLERALALRDDVAVQRALARNLYHSGAGHRRCRVLLRRLLERDPHDRMARLFLANSQVNDAEIDAALEDFRRLLRRYPDFQQAHSTYLIALQYHPATTPSQLLDEHREWARRHAPGRGRSAPVVGRSNSDSRPLRVGWISPRFGPGPVANFVLPVLEAMHGAGCEHFLYATHPPQGAIGERFAALAQGWHRFGREQPDEVAARLRDDGLDVLVDLAGHAPGNRLRALSLAPAPVQVSWGDYFCTTGVPGIDVLLTDAFLSPPGSEAHFSERLVRLPRGRLCYQPPADAPEPAARREGPIAFGCFNRASKLNDEVLVAWARILAECPGATLTLRAGSFDDPEARDYLLERARRGGIDPQRIAMHGYSSHAEVMRAYHEIDVALDPFPFSGCATSCDALWMGVPVVTRIGDTLVSRQTGALLAPLGLGDLIARDTDHYVAHAIALAADAPRRRELRLDLRARMRTLHDPERFAADLLATLRRLAHP